MQVSLQALLEFREAFPPHKRLNCQIFQNMDWSTDLCLRRLDDGGSQYWHHKSELHIPHTDVCNLFPRGAHQKASSLQSIYQEKKHG